MEQKWNNLDNTIPEDSEIVKYVFLIQDELHCDVATFNIGDDSYEFHNPTGTDKFPKEYHSKVLWKYIDFNDVPFNEFEDELKAFEEGK